MRSDFDVMIVGGGIAGITVAAELSSDHRVVVLEQEEHPGVHATGRSAALYSTVYGNEVIRLLTRASEDVFLVGAEGRPFAAQRAWLHIARPDQMEQLESLERQPGVGSAVTRISGADACALVPVLRPGHVSSALLEENAYELDVDAILGSYLKQLRRNHGVLECSSATQICSFDGRTWTVKTRAGEFRAPILVNAAGAWGDVLARQAGVEPIGLQPRRRSALLVDPPAGIDPSSWPFVLDVEEQFYFKPDAGKILMSPADETLTDPCDAMPEEIDLAIAVDRVQQVADIPVRRLSHSWAGLRTFAPDRTPVVGFDGEHPNFFWLVGQGGYGIQTAPALARAAAALIRHTSLPHDLAQLGLGEQYLSPRRLRNRGNSAFGDRPSRASISLQKREAFLEK